MSIKNAVVIFVFFQLHHPPNNALQHKATLSVYYVLTNENITQIYVYS